MVSIHQKNLANQYEPYLTFYDCVFDEILLEKLHDNAILVGPTGNEMKHKCC
ncbi:hypothetical protein T07_8731 [Trichinella nelsoni]|uniref:Uncharacterized protein n=1 Tax=Trichinella nelsoni TaxID=6336 RepID=A0A0V0RCC8_9BILA|nr:hypothetical protein T07_8731 [Trichinella nelsoni]